MTFNKQNLVTAKDIVKELREVIGADNSIFNITLSMNKWVSANGGFMYTISSSDIGGNNINSSITGTVGISSSATREQFLDAGKSHLSVYSIDTTIKIFAEYKPTVDIPIELKLSI